MIGDSIWVDDSGIGWFGLEKEREGREKWVVREERRQGGDRGIVKGNLERKRSFGGTVEIKPTFGDQSD